MPQYRGHDYLPVTLATGPEIPSCVWPPFSGTKEHTWLASRVICGFETDSYTPTLSSIIASNARHTAAKMRSAETFAPIGPVRLIMCFISPSPRPCRDPAVCGPVDILCRVTTKVTACHFRENVGGICSPFIRRIMRKNRFRSGGLSG